jgi:hypothetical protein
MTTTTRTTTTTTKEQLDVRIKETRYKLESLIRKGERQRRQHELVKEKFAFKKADISRDLSHCHQETSLYEYADAMTAARGGDNVESSYIVAMEAQLCRAVHLMGALHTQLEIVKKHNALIVRKLEQDLAREIEEQSLVEVKIMNELVRVDTEKRSLKEHYEKTLEEQQRALTRMRPTKYESGSFSKDISKTITGFYDDIEEREAKLWQALSHKSISCGSSHSKNGLKSESDHKSGSDSSDDAATDVVGQNVALASVTTLRRESKAATMA